MKLTWVAPNGTEIEFSKDSDTYRLLKTYDGLTVMPVTHLTTTAPYQDGQTRIDTKFKPREITFDVMVTAPTLEDIQAALKNLAAALNPLEGTGHLLYETEDGTEYSIHCIGNNTPTIDPSIRGGHFQKITVNLIAHDPFWYGSPPKIVYLQSAGTAFFPFDVSANWLGRNSDSVTATNAGNVDTPVTIVIDGEIENPCLWNTTTDQSINITLDMSANDVFTITTGFGNKTATYLKNGAPNRNLNGFPYINADSQLWQLTQGDNTIELSDLSISTTAIISIEWEDRYSGL